MKNLLDRARGMTRSQRRVAAAALVALLILCPSLPTVVVSLAAAVAVWGSAQQVLVGMALGVVGLLRHQKAGGQ